jgi:NDP-sugar pyrophosphorylase family protein
MEGAVVRDSVILDDVVIESGAKIEYSIIDGNTVVGKNCSVGAPKVGAKEITVIGANINVPEGTDVKEGAMISKAADLNKEGK